MSNRDPLTGLYSLRVFSQILERESASARADEKCLTVLLLDIWEFKRVNEQLGHAGGDRVITELASRLREAAPPLAFRIGGDEFALILPGVNTDDAWKLYDRLVDDLAARPLSYAGLRLRAGIAELERGDDPKTLIARADEILARDLGTALGAA